MQDLNAKGNPTKNKSLIINYGHQEKAYSFWEILIIIFLALIAYFFKGWLLAIGLLLVYGSYRAVIFTFTWRYLNSHTYQHKYHYAAGGARRYNNTIREIGKIPKYFELFDSQTRTHQGTKYDKRPYVVDVSLAVLKSVPEKPVEYVVKYFNIPINDEIFERVAQLNENLYRIKALQKNLEQEKAYINQVFTHPWYVQRYFEHRLYSELGILDPFIRIEFSRYIFKYISPAGNSQKYVTVHFDSSFMADFYIYLKDTLEYRETAKYQRSLMTNNLRQTILKRDHYTCQNPKCARSRASEPHLLLEVDHIIPISKGGRTEWNNLQTLCRSCNRSKSDKLIKF